MGKGVLATKSVASFVLLSTILVAGQQRAYCQVNPGDCCGAPDCCVNIDCIPGIPDYGSQPRGPAVPQGATCNLPAPQFDSKCWMQYDNAHPNWPRTGFPLNLSLSQCFGPSDYPPRSVNPLSSSTPMLSQEMLLLRGPSPYRSRPTQSDVVDLITGQPLLQEIDFELPFGGATFRHVRTYSENIVGLDLMSSTGDSGGTPAEGSFWDWNGLFWMMGENPIFLIDLRYGPLAVENPAAETPRFIKRCYFIPDAHHAIPFIWQQGTSYYVAPPWFDAALSYKTGGNEPTLSTETGEWSNGVGPSEFYVWLHRRTIKYTIKAHYEDLWNRPVDLSTTASVHNAPSSILPVLGSPPDGTAGYGLPYYGFITQIEDRYGNRTEITHCGLTQSDDGDGASSDNDYLPGHDPLKELETVNCKECCQNCNEKGQVKAVQLFAAGASQAAWTLLYTHRGFEDRAFSNSFYEYQEPRRHANALHSIHVYRGHRDISSPCSTLSAAAFCEAGTYTALESISPQVPADWEIEVKYLYSQRWMQNPSGSEHQDVNCASASLFDNGSLQSPGPNHPMGRRLIKTKVTRRSTAPISTPPSVSYTIYRDAKQGSAISGGRFLKAVYGNSAVQTVIAGLKHAGQAAADENTLIDLVDSADVPVADSSGTYHNVKFRDLADLYMADWRSTACGPGAADGDLCIKIVGSGNVPTALLGSIGLGAGDHVGFWLSSDRGGLGRRGLIDRRAGSTNNGTFAIYNMVRTPSSAGTTDPHNIRLFLHYPFRLNQTGFPAASQDEVFFITFVDEISDLSTYDAESAAGIRSRRVVEMNSSGFILRDRTMSYENGTVTQTGFAEEMRYDCKGRLLQHRTEGWSVANANSAGDTQGLIQEYQYSDPCCGASQSGDYCECEGLQCVTSTDPPGDLVAEGIRRGTARSTETPDTNLLLQKSFERMTGRPELVTKETTYSSPVSAPPATGIGQDTITAYRFNPADSAKPILEQRINEKRVVRPAAPRSANDATLFYPVAISAYNDRGNLEWLAVGLMQDASSVLAASGDITLGDHDEMYVKYTRFDDFGMPDIEVLDYDPATVASSANWPNGTGSPTPPSGLQRRSPGGNSALNYVTTYQNNPAYGPSLTRFPNGRETHVIRTGVQSTQDIEEHPGGELIWVYTEAIPPGAGSNPNQSSYLLLRPIQLSLIDAGRIIYSKQIQKRYPGLTLYGNTSFCEATDVVSVVRPSYDANGRVLGVGASGQGNSAVGGSMAYNGFGQVERSQAPDGTITRNVYDDRGRLEKVYRGTDDTANLGQAPPCPPTNPDCYDSDNLTLVEKRYYGTAVENAGELVRLRNLRDKPVDQYSNSNEDELGWVTEMRYDWRMRPVWVQRQDGQGQGQPLTHTLTWYDNLDRQRFVAEYGPTAPADTDPANPLSLQDSSSIPSSAVAILGASPTPTSLTEYIYNARGQVQETRRYNVDQPAGTDYTASFTFYNHLDKPIEVISPNAPTMRYAYDAKGRQARSVSVAGIGALSPEVSDTRTIYDTNDRAIHTIARERVHNASAGAPFLDETTSIASHSYTWYDLSGRVIATANFGTNNTNNIYANGSDPFGNGPGQVPYNELQPPVNRDQNGAVTGCNYGATGIANTGALLTCYGHDDAGRQNAVFHPDGTVTRTVYDGLGRVTLSSENADAANNAPAEKTAYLYDDKGRLTKIAAVLPGHSGNPVNWAATDHTLQVTEMIYGAEVLGEAASGQLSAISQNNGFIQEVRFPDPASGLPSDSDTFRFTYYSDGSVATRIDQRGIKFTHRYDELGRRIKTEIDDGNWFGPPESPFPTAPYTRIKRIDYTYTTDGLLASATATGVFDGQEYTIAVNSYDYDARRNLIADHQDHQLLNVMNFFYQDVAYTWDYRGWQAGGLGNRNRLSSITYPSRIGTNTRLTINHHYGPTSPVGTIDDLLSRVTRIGSDSGLTTLASNYTYAGSSRRVSLSCDSSAGGLAVNQTYGVTSGQPTGYTGLDQFGRVADLWYQDNSGQTQARFQYGYDKAGNRTYARVTQKPSGAPLNLDGDNDRSWQYGYDGLHQLIAARMGVLNANNQVTSAGGTIVRDLTWYLDGLGNWSGGSNNTSVIAAGDYNVNGQNDDPIKYLHHDVRPGNNRLDAVVTTFGGQATDTILTDPAGNLVSDGTYVFQYDAWNRLIQVNRVGTVLLNAGDGYKVTQTPQLGDLICRFTYDGLGRLIRKETPVSEGVTALQKKEFYYDGVRRIQEVILRPDLLMETLESGAFLTDGDTANDEGPVELLTPGNLDPDQEIVDDEPMASNRPGPPPPPINHWTDREYIYGPDYVDEFIGQIVPQTPYTGTSGGPAAGSAYYMLQDANYNVVALLSSQGHVLEQYGYEPYGSLAAIDKFAGLRPVNRVGHQGLFFERFDGTYTDATLDIAPWGVTYGPIGTGLYNGRNRLYSPALARWTSRDPNETGLPVLTALAMNGDALDATMSAFDAQRLHGDGMNLYAFVRSNPVNSRDPMGLSDGWEDFDDEISDINGHRIASLGFISEGSGWVLFGTNAAVNIAGSFLGVDLVNSFKNVFTGNAGFWDYVEVGATLTGGGAVAWKAFKWLKAYNKVSKKRKILAINKVIGQEFEDLVLRVMGWRKNSQPIHVNGRTAKPDVLLPNKVIDIKSEIYIKKTPQLETIFEWAHQRGIRPELIVSDRHERASRWVTARFDIKRFGE